jgi:hypothetical protein
MNSIKIIICFFLVFLFDYMITDDCEIKYQPNTFLDNDNLIKDGTKSIMKLNSQLTWYLRIKKN